MKSCKLTILSLLCIFVFCSECQKIEEFIEQGKPVNIDIPTIKANSYTSIVATRKDASVEVSLTYFDPEYFYKERDYPIYPDYYEVYLSKNTYDNWEMIRTIDTSYINKSFIISGLTNGELYYVYLKEITSIGEETKNTNVAIFIPSAFKPTYNFIMKDYYGHDLYSFDWNSNNDKIVYATKYYPAIFISESNNEPQLVDTYCWFPDFNNNGTKIVYSSNKGEIFDGNITPEHIAIYDVNTNKTTMVTSGYSVNKHPVWSLDNSLIAFSSSENSDNSLRIAILNPVTRKYKILETGSDLSQDIIRYSQEHSAWSADGEYIYYTHLYFTRDNINPGYYDIYRIRSNGGISEPIFNFNGVDCTPAISPDNSKLAFLTDLNGKLQIWIYNFNDNKFLQPFDANVYDFSEYWSQVEWRDNNTIMFTGISLEQGNKESLFSISVE